MDKKFVRTILGDIDPKEMGVVDSHEHLIKNGGPEMQEHIDFLMLDVEAACQEVQSFLDAGGKTFIIMDPPNVGRDVTRMVEIAKRFENKAHFVMATGFHKALFYDKYSSWLKTVSVEKIAEMLIAELTVGMDKHSYNGPVVERVPHCAGIIKCGTSYGVIHPLEQKAIKAASIAHQKTGSPILVHLQLGTMALEVVKLLKAHKVPADKIILSHTNKNPDKYYYEAICQEGVFLSFDGPDRVKYYPDSLLAENILYLVEKGYQKNIMLAMDAGRFYYQSAYSASRGYISYGVAYLLTHFVPLLRKVGVSQAAIDDFLVNNPQIAFSFAN